MAGSGTAGDWPGAIGAAGNPAPLRYRIANVHILGGVFALEVAVVAFALFLIGVLRDPFDVMEIQRLLTVRLKGKKIEFMLDDAQTQTCVHALFPQQGYVPCWWLARHTQQQRDL